MSIRYLWYINFEGFFFTVKYQIPWFCLYFCLYTDFPFLHFLGSSARDYEKDNALILAIGQPPIPWESWTYIKAADLSTLGTSESFWQALKSFSELHEVVITYVFLMLGLNVDALKMCICYFDECAFVILMIWEENICNFVSRI